jgi:hypothetical protein
MSSTLHRNSLTCIAFQGFRGIAVQSRAWAGATPAPKIRVPPLSRPRWRFGLVLSHPGIFNRRHRVELWHFPAPGRYDNGTGMGNAFT